jgi:hypothetical protein
VGILGDGWSVKVARDPRPRLSFRCDKVFTVLPLTDQFGRIYPTEGFLKDEAALGAAGHENARLVRQHPAGHRTWSGQTSQSLSRLTIRRPPFYG